MTSTPTAPSLRERTFRAVRAEITEAGMKLFLDQGFDATTIDQIAQAAGISRRSFFRYFASKEDVALGDLELLGQTLKATLEARPKDETAWAAMREALRSLHGQAYSVDAELAVANLYHETPSLTARHLEKHLRWQDLLAPEISRRLENQGANSSDTSARAVVATALACVDIAVEVWRASGGTADLEEVFDEAAAAVRA